MSRDGEAGRTAAVVLAAGRSTRMGAANKLLLEIEPGVAILRRVVEQAFACGLGPIYIVTGHDAASVEATLAGLPCIFVHNPDYAEGLSGSIRAGFRRAIADGAPGVVVLLGDMPFLPSEAIRKVVEAARARPAAVIQAVTDGQPAHPVWLPARLAPVVEAHRGDSGLRGLLASAGEPMTPIEVGADAAMDLDTPEEYESALARRRAGSSD